MFTLSLIGPYKADGQVWERTFPFYLSSFICIQQNEFEL